jgi:hypothetical protein
VNLFSRDCDRSVLFLRLSRITCLHSSSLIPTDIYTTCFLLLGWRQLDSVQSHMPLQSVWTSALLILATITICCWAHSPALHHRHITPSINCSASAPPVLSYHIHVVYDIFDDGQVAAAGELRELARERFHNDVGPDCDCLGPQPDPDGFNCRYNDGILCFILDHPLNETLRGTFSLFCVISCVLFVCVCFVCSLQGFSSQPPRSHLPSNRQVVLSPAVNGPCLYLYHTSCL